MKRLAWLRVTFIWVCGLLTVFTLGILWLSVLGLAIFLIYRAHGREEIGEYIGGFAIALVGLGAALVRFVNRFHAWHLSQHVNSLLEEIANLPTVSSTPSQSALEAHIETETDRLALDFSSEFSETFKRQLRESPTFQATVFEAKKLVEEVVAFSAISHTDEEWAAFREAWQAKNEKFAERVAQGDPLAVEVILKAIEKESQRTRTPK